MTRFEHALLEVAAFLDKIVSDRARDRDDVAGIIRIQGARLDRPYLDRLIEGLAAELGRPDLLDFYRSCVRGGGG